MVLSYKRACNGCQINHIVINQGYKELSMERAPIDVTHAYKVRKCRSAVERRSIQTQITVNSLSSRTKFLHFRLEKHAQTK